MMHPHTELRYISPEMGWGVFATRNIPRGTITWVRDELDQLLSPARLRAFDPLYHDLLEKYTFRDVAGNHILCWDHARFMNHSCDPSCRGTTLGFEVAVHDLLPGDELTDDYAELNLQPHDSFRCLCRVPHCRRIITAQDVVFLKEAWREELNGVLGLLAEVQQPLGHLVRGNGRLTPMALMVPAE